MRATVVTVSDAGSRGEREDRSGPALVELLRGAGFTVDAATVVPDEPPVVVGVVRAAVDAGARVVVTTGGTGLGPRDRTPEALAPVLDRELPGFGEAMRAAGRASTPMADLSRSLAGTLGGAVVVAVPGSRAGATESLAAVLPLLPHAVELLGGDTEHRAATAVDAVTSVTSITTTPGATWLTDETAEDETAEDGTAGDGTVRHDHVRRSPGRRSPGPTHRQDRDDPCATAHGAQVPDERRPGTLLAVYESPVAAALLTFGRELGYRRLVLLEPTGDTDGHAAAHADAVVTTVAAAGVDGDTDAVVTDHDRAELSEVTADLLGTDARWIGLMGSLRHTAPHVAPLRERGFDDEQVGRVHRPIGLDIGSRTPPEIALATLAGLVADRNGRPGGPYPSPSRPPSPVPAVREPQRDR